MIEYTSTRNNHLIDPFVHVWGWEIPVYLFVGGFVAGMMMISGYFLWREKHKDNDCVCYLLPGLSLILLSLGMGALFLDLEHKPYFWRLYTTFEITSPMSWGAWILLLVYPALMANFLLRVPGGIAYRFPLLQRASEALREKHTTYKTVGIINILLGGLLGTYTGVLLSALSARPLWNTPILALLFVVSGLSGAAAFVHMVARKAEERELMAKSDNAFLTIELFIIALMMISMVSSSQVQIAAASLLLGGPFTAVFWVGVVGIGIIVPLFYQSLAVSHKVAHCPLMPLFVISGGLILRFVIVAAGQHSHWMMALTH